MKKFLLTDGNSMLFRAYYATAYGRPMTTSKGIPTNAVFGFVSMIQKAIDTVKPDAVLVAFDAGKHTFRHDLYADYKGGRKPAPDDLVPQFALIRDFCDAYQLKWVEMENIEADDLIGTASKDASDYETYILTSDHAYLKGKKAPLKSILLDQSFTAGIGNIYADEILAACGLRPGRSCARITRRDEEIIAANTKKILKAAIKAGGTTIRSYTSSLGVTGRFQTSCTVHMQKICPRCGSAIQVKYIGGRSSYYCPHCQH